VQIERKAAEASEIRDDAIYLRKTAGQTGDNKADTGTWWPTNEASATYGGAADDWNAGLLDSDIRDSDFGVDISIYGVSGYTGYIDHVQVRVHWSLS